MKKNSHGGAGRNQGRKSRESLGLPALRKTTVEVEPEVFDACKEKYGSIRKALIFAARFDSEGSQ